MKIPFLLVALFFFQMLLAQQPAVSSNNKLWLADVEDTLDALGNRILDDTTDVVNRIRCDSMFTRSLVRALRVPNSFYYPFDSVDTMTIAYPADSSFRIFTWQFQINDQNYRQKGAIQKRTADGSLSLFPLFDASEYSNAPNDSIRTGNNWIGAIYYKIIQKSYNSQPYYTLLGYDENGFRSTKKWLDVLTFNEKGQPVFGGNYFDFAGQDSLWQPHWKRFNIEFKKEGRARLMYDTDNDVIVFDHLVSESKEPEKQYTFIPDGDYMGLKWQDGKWVFVADPVKSMSLADGKEPRPDLLMNDNGEIDETKLDQISEKNAGKKIEVKPIKRKNKVELPETKRKGWPIN